MQYYACLSIADRKELISGRWKTSMTIGSVHTVVLFVLPYIYIYIYIYIRVHQTPLTFLDFNVYSKKKLLMLLEVCMRDMNVIKGGLGVARVTFLFLHTCTVQNKGKSKKCIWTVFLIIKSHSKEILFYTTFL